MVQYFNTSWAEITRKMPELAEAGYSSIWLPPPTKGSGGLSVGYDLWDRFDLGSRDQRGSVRTRYGTEAELLRLVEAAHRFGIRIYFDNIMNHNAFDVPGFNEDTSIEVYPGFVPEDFHLRVTEEGFYRKWDNTRDWGSAWQVQNLGLSDLIDIAHEDPNTNFGRSEGDDHPRIRFVRQPDHPEYYPDLDLPLPFTNPNGSFATFTFADREPYDDVGLDGQPNTFDSGEQDGRFSFTDLDGDGQHDAGEPSEPFSDLGLFPENPDRQSPATGAGDGVYNMGDPVAEDVNQLLNRAVRWKLDRTHADGLRLDAVKHVPDYFFGATFGADRDFSSAGYLGQAQEQFNVTRGYSDWGNHRDSVFDAERPRDDAMVFGEHLGQPPGYGGYVDAGMRLVDNDLRSFFNGALGSPWTGLDGLDQPGSRGFAPSIAVMHAQSHDNDFAARRELQHAFYFTRAGIGLIYTDGNYQAETLGESGGAFPRHANTAFLGQWGDDRVPNLTWMHEQFARGYQNPRWSDGDFVAYERIDKQELNGDGNYFWNDAMSDRDGVTMILLLNDNFAAGQARPVGTSFGSTPFVDDVYLRNYSAYGGPFSTYASQLGSVVVPPGGYFLFSHHIPEGSNLWPWGTIGITQDGEPVDTVTVERRDGPDGDPGFNPLGLPDDDPTDFTYAIDLPRVTDGSALRFTARADGSAENILLKLDAGVPLNATDHAFGDPRDHPPALSTDQFVGYEQPNFVTRINPEKFAAIDTARNRFGSPGAGTYTTTIGSGVFSYDVASDFPDNDFSDRGGRAASFVYHDPEAAVGGDVPGGPSVQFVEDSDTITFWVKTNAVGLDYRSFVYYTTDGSFPEGAAGVGRDTTQVAELGWSHQDDGGASDWWTTATVSKPADLATFRYKISVLKDQEEAFPVGSVFPVDEGTVGLKRDMLTVFATDPLDADAVTFRPHGDYGPMRTGLEEGFHMIRARAFLARGSAAPIYNTFKQTFYYDTRTPEGRLLFPANEGDTAGGALYGAVVRVDPTVEEVWVHVADGDTSNDDIETGLVSGNGVGFEPFTDANVNGTRDPGEPYEDINDNGFWDAETPIAWAPASEVTPSLSIRDPLPREFRFEYVNIPADGSATLHVLLREVSSAGPDGFGLIPADAEAGHYTLLTRTVQTRGPDRRMFVAFPQQDRQVVDDAYVMKVYLTRAVADGKTMAELLAGFTVRIGSNEGGDPGVIQDISDATIHYDISDAYHEFAWALPNLFNGEPNYVHKIHIDYEEPGQASLLACRRVLAAPSAQPTVAFISPPIQDGGGQPFRIVLNDVADPQREDRVFTVQVRTDDRVTALDLAAEFGPTDLITFTPAAENPVVEGRSLLWSFTWDFPLAGTYPGVYGLRADAHTDGDGIPENSEYRNATVIYRETVTAGTDADSDDDGLADVDETTAVDLPERNPETWTNGEVHVWEIYGRSLPARPDTDGDGLPDGLELGWRGASNPPTAASDEPFDDVGLGDPLQGDGNGVFDWEDINANGRHDYYDGDDEDAFPDTLEPSEPFTDLNGNTTWDPATDTDGDGFANFRADLDPPFYNTVPDNWNLPNYDFNDSRTRRIHGTTTDPTNPDSDGDGIPDGVEDADRNGWVNGDGDPLAPDAASPNDRGRWPNGRIDPGEDWTETDPNNGDTDGDGAGDGFGEDFDRDGLIAGDLNGNRIYDEGEAWSETDPLNPDTDGDGLPDGFERDFGLDPLDNGSDNRATAIAEDGDPDQGAAGDPDGDLFTNTQELANGTNPRFADTGTPPLPGTITIGPLPPDQQIVIGSVVDDGAFTDWTADDLMVLDEYEGDGPNNQSGDTFPAFDGFDSSRDIVAFYMRDGGDPAQGGDGQIYFRVDFRDLRPFAEEGNLDLYVVIDTGNTGSGEYALPDDVDTGTEMRWEAVVAAYSSNFGTVYTDTDNTGNSTAIGQELTAFGVEPRGPGHPDGFRGSHYDSALDAMEMAISRQALLDAGWNGLNPGSLNFQVFTTRDGTSNSPVGLGDIGGRSDIRDTIYDDFLAEDYWRDQTRLAGANSVLRGWFSHGGSTDRGKSAKVLLVAHGNQAIQPGSVIQELINDDNGGGYFRLLDAHEAFAVPLTLHVTATLASAIEWAASDPAKNKPWRDGPTFNDRIARLAADGIVLLTGTTFSDHILPYFPRGFTADNVALAGEFLEEIYGSAPSTRLFWTPERVLDDEVLADVRSLGYTFTLADQLRHLFKWFGRQAAIGSDGFRINRINGMHLIPLHDRVSAERFANTDNGVTTSLRNLLNRRARSGLQDQVVAMLSSLEDFANPAQADAYDRNLRWLASRPWIRLVTPDALIDGLGGDWFSVDRGDGVDLPLVAHDFIDHATQEDYDHWYYGQADREEGLAAKTFQSRSGLVLPQAFGEVGVSGLADDAWNAASAVAAVDDGLADLATGTVHAATFVTAFHNNSNNDLGKFSTGAYINPDTSFQTLAEFSGRAHPQLRFAAAYGAVRDWADDATAGLLDGLSAATQADLDLDGVDEYLLFNDRLFALFESLGGRMTAAWARNPTDGTVVQVAGNFLGFPDDSTEREGEANVVDGEPGAFRTSGFKDWFADLGEGGVGYVNTAYNRTAPASGTGHTFTSVDGNIVKTLTLTPGSDRIEAAYALSPSVQRLYVRHGLSPDLRRLLTAGQADLGLVTDTGEAVELVHDSAVRRVRAVVDYGSADHSAVFEALAIDDDPAGGTDFDTVPMRNQAQTQQVEVSGSGTFSFSLGFDFGTATVVDGDEDGLPDDWEDAHGLDSSSAAGDDGRDGDPDGDGLTNRDEYLLGGDPRVANSDLLRFSVRREAPNAVCVTWDTRNGRGYVVEFSHDLVTWHAATTLIPGTGATESWLDDGSGLTVTPPFADGGPRFYRVRAMEP